MRLCDLQTLRKPPFCDVFVVSCKEHRRDFLLMPDRRTGYWGYSSSPLKWLSSSKQRDSGKTPGSIRATVSMSTIAGSSPPVST